MEAFLIILKTFSVKKGTLRLRWVSRPGPFRLPVECSIIRATVVSQNFLDRIYLRLFGYGYIMNYLLIFPNNFS